MTDQSVLRAATLAAATARGAARSTSPYAIGAYIVSLAMVGVAFELASRSALYWSY